MSKHLNSSKKEDTQESSSDVDDSEEWSGNSEDSKDSDSEYEDSHPQKKKIKAEVTSIWFSFVQLEFEVATMEAYVIPDYDLASGACNQKFRGLPTC